MNNDECQQIAHDVTESMAEHILGLRAAQEGDDAEMLEIFEDDPLWGMPDGYLEAFELWLRMSAEEFLSQPLSGDPAALPGTDKENPDA